MTSRAEPWVKIDALERHNRKLLDDSWRHENQLDNFRVGWERHEARDVESAKAFTGTKVELAKAKEAFGVLEILVSPDRLAMRSAIYGRDRGQDKVVTASAKLQVANGAFTAPLDYL